MAHIWRDIACLVLPGEKLHTSPLGVDNKNLNATNRDIWNFLKEKSIYKLIL